MHVANISAPTQQFLIMGGGNFRFFHRAPSSRRNSLPRNSERAGGYEKRRMNPGTQPRLYHSTSLLLPDGRIFVSGGTVVRAAIEVKSVAEVRDGHTVETDRAVRGGRVILNTDCNPRNDTFTFAEAGKYAIPAEIHQFEIFYPPYLFAGGQRPEISESPAVLAYWAKATFRVKHMLDDKNKAGAPSVVLIKLGAVARAFDCGQRLCSLPFTLDQAAGTVTALAPTNPNLFQPGYYMLFDVNNSGKPAIAPFVRLGK